MEKSAIEFASEVTSRRPEIALIGNPNTGKTTVFNALCGTRQRVGNFPGVTVEKKTGITLLSGDKQADVIDLPGLYSLKAVSPDEDVAADVIMGRVTGTNKPDVILFVLDSTNLKRNLYLFSQIAELGMPLVVVLTMTDLLERENIKIDFNEMEKQLGVPVLPLVGRDKTQLDRIKKVLFESIQEKPSSGISLNFPDDLERIASDLKHKLDKHVSLSHFEAREILFFKQYTLLDHYNSIPEAITVIEDARNRLGGRWAPSIIAFKRYAWADSLLKIVEKREKPRGISLTERLDSFLTSRVFGLLSFIGIMYLVFQSIYTWAGPLMDFIDSSFSFMGGVVYQWLDGMPILQSLVVDGMISGVGSVVIFVPQIAILFLFIAFLEDSGYLSRAAFLMDRLLGWTGLNGRAFIPMLSGFACAIPGIMSTRIMPDPRARLTTILIVPLMSCSARLPVYMLFIGAFIEPAFGAGWAAFALFAMHALGIIISLPIAWVLNRGILNTPSIPFVLEMPPYKMPQAYNVLYRAYEASKDFLIRAGTIIFAMSIFIWFLSYFPRPALLEQNVIADANSKIEDLKTKLSISDSAEQENIKLQISEIKTGVKARVASMYLEQSILGRAGKAIQPVFAPLGFDWRLSVGILSAFPAREVIVSTLGIIYNVGENVSEESETLKSRLSSGTGDAAPYTPLTAITLMVFFALSSQCMSTLAMVKRELNSWSWMIGLFTYMTVLAYIIAIIVKVTGTMLGMT